MKIGDIVVWRRRLELGFGIIDHLNMSGPVIKFKDQPLMCIPEHALIKQLDLEEDKNENR